MQLLNSRMFEKLILRICEQLEILEWNLLDGNALQLQPQFIYLSHGEEFYFVFYPSGKNSIFQEIRSLIEYLLTKLDHSDEQVVKSAYELYEISLREIYQIQELKDAILRGRLERKQEETLKVEAECIRVAESECLYEEECYKNETKRAGLQEQLEEKFAAFREKARSIWIKNPKEEHPTVVYPQEEIEKEEISIHPTICIATALGEPRGLLIYEGIGDYPDFELNKSICVVGKSTRARMRIDRETISQFHAKIEYEDAYYIEDMNSTNGTFVNDAIVNYRERICLHAGDVIRFADVKYRFL